MSESPIAVIKTGGKQYLVKSGDELNVEKLDDSVKSLPDLLTGRPVPITLIRQWRSQKIRVLKFRAKSRYKRIYGHRQQLTRIKVGPLT